MQEEIENSSTPRHVGRIPEKISSRFAHLTAAEWKTYGALFLSCSLKGRVPTTKYHLVCKLQRVCFLLECRVLTDTQINQVHAAIIDFCKLDEKIYGPTRKVAFHLICHLTECIRDFGPIHGFWLFAYVPFDCPLLSGSPHIFGFAHVDTNVLTAHLAKRTPTIELRR
jgi:hypothetical protein